MPTKFNNSTVRVHTVNLIVYAKVIWIFDSNRDNIDVCSVMYRVQYYFRRVAHLINCIHSLRTTSSPD